MGFLAGLGIAALGQLVGGAIDSGFQQANDSHSAKLSLHTSKELFKYQNSNKYQFMVDDLNKAGLNPMLAVGGMQGSAGGVISGSGNKIDSSGINSAMATRESLRIAKTEAETERLKVWSEMQERQQNIEYLKALTNRTNLLAPSENALMVAQSDFHRANILKSTAEIDKIYNDIHNNNRITQAQIDNLIANTRHLRVITGNESINHDLLLKARDSKSEALKRELLNTWYGQLSHQMGYLMSLQTQGLSGFGVNNHGTVGYRFGK